MDPLEYALNFYRPPSGEEFEWGFPINYKTLLFSEEQASSESKTVKKAFDKYKPDFYYALHNYGFGGAFFVMDTPRRELFPLLRQLVKNQGLPLRTGLPESPFLKEYADGIYSILRSRDRYEYFDQLEGDPEQRFKGGARAIDYLKDIVPHAA